MSATDPNRADPGSERIILPVDEPQANHNGGQMVFGPDGYLYVGLGDGGGANDTGIGHSPVGNGQDTTTLLGKILRLDMDGGDSYAIPPDNPFVGKAGREEIFAYGLRNPFRFSFDAGGSHQLFVGDVGQNLWEEVDVVVKGGNYGWHIREGTHCFDPSHPNDPPKECPATGASGEPLRGPIIEYGHDVGISVIGGTVYRGGLLPQLQGQYIFGDWRTSFGPGSGGKLFVTAPSGSEAGLWVVQELQIAPGGNGNVGAFVLSISEDADHELYVLTSALPGPVGNTGKVFKLVPVPR